ncbi:MULTISPECIES: hypothetical protein [Clostridia]|nr:MULTISPECIES: hypothetical protein [Clostridia]
MLLFKTLHIMELAIPDRMVNSSIAAEKNAKNTAETLPVEYNL